MSTVLLALYFFNLLLLAVSSVYAQQSICIDKSGSALDQSTLERMDYIRAAGRCARENTFANCEQTLMDNETTFGRAMGAAIFTADTNPAKDTRGAFFRWLQFFDLAVAEDDPDRSVSRHLDEVLADAKVEFDKEVNTYQNTGYKSQFGEYYEAEKSVVDRSYSNMSPKQKLVEAYNTFDAQMKAYYQRIDESVTEGAEKPNEIKIKQDFEYELQQKRDALLRQIAKDTDPQAAQKARDYIKYRESQSWAKIQRDRLVTLRKVLAQNKNRVNVIGNIVDRIPYGEIEKSGRLYDFGRRIARSVNDINLVQMAKKGAIVTSVTLGEYMAEKGLTTYATVLLKKGISLSAATGLALKANLAGAATDTVTDPTCFKSDTVSHFMSYEKDCKQIRLELDPPIQVLSGLGEKAITEIKKQPALCEYLNAVYEKQFNWKVTCGTNGLSATRGTIKKGIPEFESSPSREIELTWDQKGQIKTFFVSGVERRVASEMYQLEFNSGEPTQLRLIGPANLSNFRTSNRNKKFRFQDEHRGFFEETEINQNLNYDDVDANSQIKGTVMKDYRSLRLAMAEMKNCCQDASQLGSRCDKYGIQPAAKAGLAKDNRGGKPPARSPANR